MTKVWTYVIGKELNETELAGFVSDGKAFVAQWTAHDKQLNASFAVYEKRIALVKVNEDAANASGCGIDKLLRFIKESETKYNMELLNRMLVAYRGSEGINIVHSSKIKELLEAGVINEETPVFNTSVSSSEELLQWEKPLKNTWLNRMLVKS